MPSAIRNILQTVQEREIIKTAPDMVCYLEGLPYIRNPYLETTQTQQQPVFCNFNNHVTAITGQYSVDNLIPTCAIALSVPNDQKRYYMAPGGNHIIQAMMEVQIYAKGYYLSTNGNSIYRRIFKGLVSHASYNDNGKTLEISIQCSGVLQFLEQMQIDLSPALMSNSPLGPTVYISNQANMSPLLAIMDTLTRSISTEGFQLNTLTQQTIAEGPYAQAIQSGYVAKWQNILNSVKADIHIYGLTQKDAPDPDGSFGTRVTNRGSLGNTVKNPEDPKLKTVQGQTYGQDNEATQYGNILYDKIRQWLPDSGDGGTPPLLNGRIVSRAERLRALIAQTGYEGYQDIDGTIIIKPPLYNLDVTNVGQQSSSTTNAAVASTDIYAENNPFVINLVEIENEQETEDQQGIRATRMTIRGPWDPHWQVQGTDDKRYVSEYVDIKLLQQFGLREEPARDFGFKKDDDKLLGFAVAVMELIKANRGYRTYTCRIPFRPELKLGFPCFIPHRDMYGYLRTVAYSYNVGGACTMDLGFDLIRRRPVYPVVHKSTQQQAGVNSTGTSNNNAIIFTSQKNLINRWVKVAASDTAASSGSAAPSLNQFSASTATDSCQLPGQPSSMPLAPTIQPNADNIKLLNYRQSKLGSTWMCLPDSVGNSWQVQVDDDDLFTSQIPCDGDYLNTIRYAQPFTDQKGYELVTPFPWGRWISLKDAIHEFTQTGYISATVAPSPLQIPAVQSFLFAGVGTPTGNLDPSSALSSALTTLQNEVGQNTTVFELTYPSSSGNTTQGDLSLLQQGTPDAALQTLIKNDINARVQMFVMGPAQPHGNKDAALQLPITPQGSPSLFGSLQNVGAIVNSISRP